jgi:hydroxyacylglutathione hydrolase
MTLAIESFATGSLGCNCSILYSEATMEAIIIDPGDDKNAILNRVSDLGIKVKALLHTHAHFDHIGASKELKQEFNCPMHLHQGDKLLYQALPAQAMMFGRPPILPGKVDSWLEDGEEFSLSDEDLKNFLKTVHTPGHTQGSCCFYLENAGDRPILFAGDTLFQGSIGRTDLPGGDFNQIKKSIKERLYSLPDESLVITGHGPSTTLFEEMRFNPYVSK